MDNPFADLIPKAPEQSASGKNPFADLIPAKPEETKGGMETPQQGGANSEVFKNAPTQVTAPSAGDSSTFKNADTVQTPAVAPTEIPLASGEYSSLDPRGMDNLLGSIARTPGNVAQFWYDIKSRYYTNEYANKVLTGTATPEELQDLRDSIRQANINKNYYGQSKVEDQQDLEFAQAYKKGTANMLGYLFMNPSYLQKFGSETMGASLPAVAASAGGALTGAVAGAPFGPPGMVTGATIGAATGAGVGSFGIEYTRLLADEMEAAGFDSTNTEQVDSFISDPVRMADIRDKALKRGIAIGTVDAMTSLIGARGAGRALVDLGARAIGREATSESTRRLAGEAAANWAIETAGEGLGEGSAQLWTEGEVNVPDVVLEMAVGGYSSAVQAGLSTGLNYLRRQLPGEQVSGPAVAQPGDQPGIPINEDSITSIDQAIGEGRTWFGFLEDGVPGATVTKDPVEALAFQGRKDASRGRLIAVSEDDISTGRGEFMDTVAAAPDLETVFANDVKFVVPETAEAAKQLLIDSINATDVDTSQAKFDEALMLGARIKVLPDDMKAFYVGEGTGKAVVPEVEDISANLGYGGYQVTDSGAIEVTGVDYNAKIGQKANKSKLVDFNKLKNNIEPGTFVPSQLVARELFYNNPKLLSKFMEIKDQELKKFVEDPQVNTSSKVVELFGFDSNSPVLVDHVKEGRIVFTPDSRLVSFDTRVFNHTNPSFRIIPTKTQDEVKISQALDKSLSRYTVLPRQSEARMQIPFRNRPIVELEISQDVIDTKGIEIRGFETSGLSSEVQAKVIEISNWVHKRFKFKRPTLVTFADQPLDNHFAGWFNTFEQNGELVNVIWMNKIQKAPERLYGTLIHEFGHAIGSEFFGDAPLHVRAAIYGAYRRFRETTPSVEHFMRKRLAGWMTSTDISPADQKSGVSQFITGKRAYALSFEEWFAEQVMRHFLYRRPATGKVDQFFKRVASSIANLLKRYGELLGVKNFKAEPEMQIWLNELLSGRESARWGDVIWRQTEEQTLRENVKILGESAAPIQEESSKVYATLDSSLAQDLSPRAKAVTRAAVDRFNWVYKYFLNFRQVAARNSHIPELQITAELLEAAQRDAGRDMVKAEERVKEIQRLGADKASKLGKFLFALTEMEYLSNIEREKKVRRQPTVDELQRMYTKYGITEDVREVYLGIKQDFISVAERVRDLAISDAQKIKEPQAAATRTKEAVARFNEWMKAPYFPMMRFGSYSMTIRDADNKVVSFDLYENAKDQKKAFALAQKAYPSDSGFSVNISVVPEDVKQFMGVPPWMLDKLREMPGLSNEQKNWIDQFKFELAPSRSFQKRLMARKGTKGYSEDFIRTYATYFFQQARYMARIKYEPQITEQIDSLRVTSKSPGDQVAKGKIANYLQDVLNEFLNPSADWAWLRSLTAIWHLGGVVSSAGVNMTQTFIATTPYLASKFGDVKATAELVRSARHISTFWRTGKLPGMSPSEERAYSRALEEDFMDQSMAVELAALSAGDMAGIGFGKVQRGWIEFSSKAMLLFQMVEQWNRRVSFRAAYNLAIKDPNNEYVIGLRKKHLLQYNQLINEGFTGVEAGAFLAGKDAILTTHYDYSKIARPRFMRGRKGVFFAFYMFVQNTAFLLYNNPQTAMRYALIMTLLAGPMGLMPDDLEDLLNALGRKAFGGDFNLERSARSFLVDLLGEDPAIPIDMILHGTGRYSMGMVPAAGMLPGMPQTDLSSSIAMQKVLPISISKLLEPGADYKKALADTTEQAAGAAFSPLFGLMKMMAASELDWSDLKRWEMAMPRALRLWSKSLRNSLEGGERDYAGNKVIPFDTSDPTDVGELVLMAGGFNPTKVSQHWDRETARREIDMYWQSRREYILQQAYKQKFQYKSQEGYAEVLDELRKFNKEVRAIDGKKVITSETLKRSFERKLKNKNLRENQGLSPNSTPGLQREVDQLYPEVGRYKVPK